MKYFGTDGIRQKSEDFTPEFITKLVQGLVDYAGDKVKVFIAGDTRESTEWILADLESALETFGIEFSNAGILPTPAINYCFYQMGFDFAIDITASHNPYNYNGIKIFERGKKNGQKLCEKGCESIEKALASSQTRTLIPATIRENLHQEALDLYLDHLKKYIEEADFKNLKIGLDCANGATSIIGKTLLEEFGASVSITNSDKNYGTKINDNCGSTYLEPLKNLVKTQNLDFGIAYDGDGDRCLMIDHSGNTIDGDQIIAILTNYLNLDSIVTTVMANQGLLIWIKENNIKTEITPVGDANVYKAMQEKHIDIGGEQSGHIILPNEPTGDGILTSLMVSKAISKTNKSLKELASIITKYPQIIVNIEATNEQKNSLNSPSVKNIIDEYSKKLESVSGRLLVRPSGTEPLIRITMWGNDEQKIANLAHDLSNELNSIL